MMNAKMVAEVTMANLPEDDGRTTIAERHLILLDWSKTELEALEAGMHNQTPEARALSNALWSAQMAAQQDIVTAAMQVVYPAAIMAITHRQA